MARISDTHSGNSAYTTYFEVTLDSQSTGSNSSVVDWKVYAIKTSGTGYSGSDTGDGRAVLNGVTVWDNGSYGYNFTGSTPKTVTLASGSRTITHNSDGNKTVSYSFENKLGVLGTAAKSGTFDLPRIAKVPSTPAAPSVGSQTTSSVSVDWSAPSNNGASITGYQTQRATNSAFSAGVVTFSSTDSSDTVTGLASGTDYWIRVRAQNSVGYSGWSGSTSTSTKPGAPSGLSSSSVTPTSFTLAWTAPSGNAIDSYDVQQATSSNFSGATTWTQTSTSRAISGLAPAKTYYYRVRATTRGGDGAWSSTFTITPGLPAPTGVTAATETGLYRLRVSWDAPSVTTGLTGYRIYVSENSNMGAPYWYANAAASASSYDMTIQGGRVLYVRVVALTAGGENTPSSIVRVVHLLEAGNTDGWTRVGSRPSGISYLTSTGIRRGTVGSSTPALLLESLSTGSASIASGALGMQRTFTGLKVGKTYRFQARATAVGAPLGNEYRLEVVTEGNAATVTVNSNTDLGYVDFVADATSVVARIMLMEAVSVSGSEPEIESTGFHAIKLLEMVSDYPTRLQDTVLESDLANHLDIACNSVGASWFVAKDGVTRFRLPGEALPLTAVFTDDSTPESMSYIDISAGVDTRSLINRIVATNYGKSGSNEANTELVVEDATSKATYGTYPTSLDLNLYTVAPYDASLSDRLAELLSLHKGLEPLVQSITWNAQEDLELASALEVGDRIQVGYRGVLQDSQIVSLNHNITPTRWLITINIRSLT